MTKDLKYGETPWDSLSRDELLREVQRMYAAISAMYSALRIASHGDTSGYWGPQGTGGEAIEMGRQIIEPLHEAYESERIYRAFFRYAVDLLFQSPPGYRICFGWAVCPACGQMFGDMPDGRSAVGLRCADLYPKDCAGVLRPLEWSDLEKSEAGTTTTQAQPTMYAASLSAATIGCSINSTRSYRLAYRITLGRACS